MMPDLLFLAGVGLVVYLAFVGGRHQVRARRERLRREQQRREARLHEMVVRRTGTAGRASFGASGRQVGQAATDADGRRVSRQTFTGEAGSHVEVVEEFGEVPGGVFSITRSTTTSRRVDPGLMDLLGGRPEDRFHVVPPAELPTFRDVGGMHSFKQEVEGTLGLILRHGEGAEAYRIRWNGLLLHGPPGVGKTFLARALAGHYGLNLLHVSTGDLVEGIVGQSAKNVQRVFATAADNRPCLLFFDEFDSIAQRRDAGSHAEERRTVNQLLTSLEAVRGTRGVVVMAATNDLDHLDPAVVRPGRFDRHVRVDLPDAEARRAILAAQLRGRPACGSVDLDGIAARTQGLTPAALTRIVDAAALRAFREAAATGGQVEITMEHLLAALEAHGGEDRPTVEDWDWEHLILPPDVKAEMQQLQAMLEDPRLAESFGVDAPTGVLLAGPPGTGKTTVARVLAARARCSFYPVSAADVISKWVGESEGNIRRLFERARANRPSIIFIDELDAIGAVRGTADESASRQLNQLLVEIDGLSSSRGILVIGATNRPELLDPALLRGGRLSRTIRLELPDPAAREAILRLNTARMPTVGLDVTQLVAATDGLSGADLKALCQQAAVHAMMRVRPGEAEGSAAGAAAPAVLPADFQRALSG